MTEKEKAKAYDEAIERAREWYNNPNSSSIGKSYLYAVFPSLAESEDEGIRKTIIDFLKNIEEENESYLIFDNTTTTDMIAWLEKQGKQKSIDDLTQQEAMDIAVAKCFEQDEPQVYEIEDGKVITYSETGGYKVIEPKFKVGDWIVTDKNHIWLIDEDCSTTGYSYRLISQNGKVEVGDYNIVDEHARLWTIQDAKPGDVLAFDDETIVIFKDLYNATTFHSYCHIEDGLFDVNKDEMPDWWEGKGFHPATKEHRDLLFQKMHEAGYMWDSKSKQLLSLKAEPSGKQKSADKVKPKFHKGDWVVVSTTKGDRVVQIASVEYFKDGHPSYFTTEGRWFDNRTKARLLTNKDVEITTIPENRAIVNKIKSWSKEDEDYYDAIIAKLEVTQDDAALTDNQMEFLKSLKQRYTWKPSDAQMQALKEACDKHWEPDGLDPLYTLYEDLKKLKEE